MVKQISLDTWSTDRLNELLKKGTNIVTQTNLPIVLYRETLEEKEGSFEELICTLNQDHVVEQVVTSGGMVIPSIKQQVVFSIIQQIYEFSDHQCPHFCILYTILQNQHVSPSPKRRFRLLLFLPS